MITNKVFQGSTIPVDITLIDADGELQDISLLQDVVVLLSRVDGVNGKLALFKKVAGGGALAWTNPSAGTIHCEVPASVTTVAPLGKIAVEVKVVVDNNYQQVMVLEEGFELLKSKVATV
jgi:hypothetical protein